MPLTKRVAENGKIYAKLSDLMKWESNPRVRTDEDYQALKRKIVRLGLFRDFFVNSDGIVVPHPSYAVFQSCLSSIRLDICGSTTQQRENENLATSYPRFDHFK